MSSVLKHRKFWSRGGCHCGEVLFECLIQEPVEAWNCNCSICQKIDFQHYIVEKDHFILMTGEDSLTEYTFNKQIAKHLFCRHCGIKSFYQPRSHPDKWSVNLRCVDLADVKSIRLKSFDGEHWEKSMTTHFKSE